MTPKQVSLAVCQTALQPEAVGRNLDAMACLAADAAANGADLVVFPEMVTTGYGIGDAIARLAEPADGQGYRRLADAARDSRVAICFGYPEAANGAVYNSAALIGPDGTLIGNHRKTHLIGAYERRHFTPGDNGLTLVDVAGFKVAVLICYEVEFPELVRRAALAGAELIVVPTATSDTAVTTDFAKVVVASRATENNIFVGYANHCGRDDRFGFTGGSIIAGPLVQTLAVAGTEETVLTATLDTAKIAEGEKLIPYLQDRRPELYGEG